MKNFEMINKINTLGKFSGKKLPQKISYAIMKNLMALQNEYGCYEKLLANLFDKYDGHTVKDENGNPIMNDSNIPIMDDDGVSKEFYSELEELLGIDVDISLYLLPDNAFDYEDSGRHDALSASDIMELQSVLCKNG